MGKRLVLVLLLSLVVLGGAGCRLLGVGEQTDGSRAEVERTIDLLAAAAESNDPAGIVSHLAANIRINLPGISPLSLVPLSQEPSAVELENIWGGIRLRVCRSRPELNRDPRRHGCRRGRLGRDTATTPAP